MKWTILNVLLIIVIITTLYHPFSQIIENDMPEGPELSNTRTKEQSNVIKVDYITQYEDYYSNIHKQPNSFQNIGEPRSVQFLWQNSEQFLNLFNQTDIIISDKEEMMYREILNFSHIGALPIISAVEDYDPILSPEINYIQKSETLYMGFQINGSQVVKINGFWIYLRGESEGIIRFQLYPAKPGVEAVTLPNTTSPLTQEIDTPISPNILLGEERWIWLGIDETLILDPLDTYANTFYIGISRPDQDSSKINWVCCSDNSWPDDNDEGDAYAYTFDLTYLQKDFFLNYSISPVLDHPYPTDINLKVNNTAISNQLTPGIGRWDSDELVPAINMTNNKISLSITYSWPDFYQWQINYDVIWYGFFYENSMADTEYQVSVDQSTSDWSISFVADYPSNSENQMMNVSIEKEWTVLSVYRNTINHTYCTESPCNLLIQEASDGVWEINCISQNKIIEIDILDIKNKPIIESYYDEVVKICGKILEPNGEKVSSGRSSLYIYDPNEVEKYCELDCLIDNSSEYSVIFLWDIHSEFQIEGNFIINLIWSNGTEAGITNANIFIKIPIPPLKRIFTYLGWSGLGVLVSVSVLFLIRQRYYVPQKRAHLLRLKTMMYEYQDSIKLTRLLIIHKQSGLCFLDPMADEKKIDANLMAGLLHAFSSFGGSLLEEHSFIMEKEGETILQHMNYKDHHIVMFDGQITRIAAIYTSIPSENIKNQLNEFSKIFEEQFYNELTNWTGDLDKFSYSINLIEKIFALSFILPHKVKLIDLDEINLNKLEKKIYNYSSKLKETKNYFYLEDLLNNYNDKKEKKVLYALEAIISLRQKGILFSYNIEKE